MFPIPGTYLWVSKLARLGLLLFFANLFFLPPYIAVPGFKPTSVEWVGPLKYALPTELLQGRGSIYYMDVFDPKLCCYTC